MVERVVAWVQAQATHGHWAARLALALARRFVVLEFFDRSLAIAAQMLVAFIPLVLALTSVVADDSAVAEEIVRRLGLTGASVQLVTLLFDADALPEDSSGMATLSLLFLLISLYLFGKRVRHLYERAYDVRAGSARQEWRNLWWVCLLAGYVLASGFLRNIGFEHGAPWSYLMFALTFCLLFGFSWWTPRFLLARRLSWRHALPSAITATIGLAGVGIWSVIWLPEIIVDNAERYGGIGITFGIFTWLYAISLALVAGALVAGAVEDVRQDRKPATIEFPV